MVFDIFNRMYQFSVLKNYTRQVFNGFVIPAKAGIQGFLCRQESSFIYLSLAPCFRSDDVWIPACAGMTDKESFQKAEVLQPY
jgi:hypothetical protein